LGYLYFFSIPRTRVSRNIVVLHYVFFFNSENVIRINLTLQCIAAIAEFAIPALQNKDSIVYITQTTYKALLYNVYMTIPVRGRHHPVSSLVNWRSRLQFRGHIWLDVSFPSSALPNCLCTHTLRPADNNIKIVYNYLTNRLSVSI